MTFVAAAGLGLVALVAGPSIPRGDVSGPGMVGFLGLGTMMVLGTVAWWLLLGEADRRRLDPWMLVTFLGSRLVGLPRAPNLSDDRWRYAWDGHLVATGRDPYAQPPRELWNGLDDASREALGALYLHMNSAEWPSVYPPLAQGLFALGAWLTPGDPHGAVLAVRSAALVADVVAVLGLDHLARRWGADRRVAWVYALCPLVVYEHAVGAHLDSIVPGLLVGMLVAVEHARPRLAAVALGLAAAAKLVPLVVLPALAARVARRDLPIVLAVPIGLAVLPFLALTDTAGARQVLAGLALYVRLFEFNSGVNGVAAAVVGGSASRVLAGVTAAAILAQAWRDRRPGARALADAATFALGVHLLLGTTIHPWYATPLVAVGAAAGWRWPLVWATLLPLTYAAYWTDDLHPPIALVAVEHTLVLGVAAAEVAARAARRRDPWTWPGLGALADLTRPARVRIKRELVAPGLAGARTVLDVGSGSGWLAASLAADGFAVTAVDVRDRHRPGGVVPQLVSGALPDGPFDVVLLATMLHHASDPDALLAEAARVGRRVVVVEDVPEGALAVAATSLADRLANLDPTPPRFRTEAAWRDALARHGLVVVATHARRTLGLFPQITLVAERAADAATR